MQMNLETEIRSYVESKRGIWSDRTLPVVRATLTTLAPYFSHPDKNYQRLLAEGRTRYTIKTYFTIAGRFEEEVLGKKRYKEFLERQKAAFKNCYKDKVRLIKPEQYKGFLKMYRNSNPAMYNLLVLMGEAGLRISEALNACWEDFLEGSYLRVIGKGRKQRVIPFSPTKLVSSEKKPKGKIIGTCAFRFIFDRDLKPFTPHDFRAFYATSVANHPELSIKDAAFLLGHSDIKTTSRYVRTDLTRIASVLNRKGRAGSDQQGLHSRD